LVSKINGKGITDCRKFQHGWMMVTEAGKTYCPSKDWADGRRSRRDRMVPSSR
jgi:hypothetical protein